MVRPSKGVSSNHKHIHVYPMVSGRSVPFLIFSDVPALFRPLHILEMESCTSWPLRESCTTVAPAALKWNQWRRRRLSVPSQEMSNQSKRKHE